MNGRKVNIDYISGLNELQGIFILVIAYAYQIHGSRRQLLNGTGKVQYLC